MYGYVLYDTYDTILLRTARSSIILGRGFPFLGAPPEFRADEADYASVFITDSVRYVIN